MLNHKKLILFPGCAKYDVQREKNISIVTVLIPMASTLVFEYHVYCQSSMTQSSTFESSSQKAMSGRFEPWGYFRCTTQ